jgi:hypothetical protein
MGCKEFVVLGQRRILGKLLRDPRVRTEKFSEAGPFMN